MNKRLRVLFVNRMAGLVRGGGETFDLEISRALEGLGCEVHYLTGAPMFGRAPLPIAHPNVHYLHTPYLPWFPWDRVKGGWRVRMLEFQWFERRAAVWIRKNQERFDVIQVCELPYLVRRLKVEGLRLKGERVKGRMGEEGLETRDMRLETSANVQRSTFNVQLSSGGATDSSSQSQISRPPAFAKASVFALRATPDKTAGREVPGLKSHVSSLRSKIVLRLTAPNTDDRWGGIPLADALIASGTSIEKIKKSIRPDVVDVPNGVNLDRFKPAIKAHDGPPVLLYVARFQAFKNHAILIRAFRKVVESCPDVVLKLVGSGPLKGQIEKQVAEAGLKEKVIFLGEVDHADLPAVNQAAAIAVISSEYESFCFAAIEAMACGLPVITTDCGWVPRLIGDLLEPVSVQWATQRDPKDRFKSNVPGEQIREAPGGLVVSRLESESLAKAIERLLGDEGMRGRCGKWNCEKAEREHGWESSARKLLAVYDNVLAG